MPKLLSQPEVELFKVNGSRFIERSHADGTRAMLVPRRRRSRRTGAGRMRRNQKSREEAGSRVDRVYARN